MNEYIGIVVTYIFRAIAASLVQFVGAFGFLLLLAFIMNFTNLMLQKSIIRLIGQKAYIYIFGWIGVPIHEIGHLLFCIIFGHRVNKVELFDYNATSGSLGYVDHTYNRSNLYQRIGNFFIGIGPVIIGCSVIYILLKILLNINTNLSKLYNRL